jgi:hypothetical protein
VAEGHSTAGRSIIEMLWEQADILYAQLVNRMDNQIHAVDNIVDYLAGDVEFEDDAEDVAQSIAEYWELRGKLGGLTYSLAKMLNPYENTKKQMDEVKDMLRQRWEDEEEE